MYIIYVDYGDMTAEYTFSHDDEYFIFYRAVKDLLGVFQLIKLSKTKTITKNIDGLMIDEVF